MFTMSLTATSTLLLNTSRSGDSTSSLYSSEQYCASAWQPFQWKNVSKYPTSTSSEATWGHFLLSSLLRSAQVLLECWGLILSSSWWTLLESTLTEVWRSLSPHEFYCPDISLLVLVPLAFIMQFPGQPNHELNICLQPSEWLCCWPEYLLKNLAETL